MTRPRRSPLLVCEPTAAAALRTIPHKDSSMSSALMAAHLAKWWKSKFLNGYKQFSVVPTDGSDGRASDTEELLARHDYGVVSDDGRSGFGGCAASRPHAPASTPAPAPAPAASNERTAPRRQLSFEEFECDVSVEGGVDPGGQERQEFSFTLYDFDGYGKITKDDIAGLVTTIYETLGSSVKVPHYGSKTIKVKLTVSPDQRVKKSDAAGETKSPGRASPTPPASSSQPQLNPTATPASQAAGGDSAGAHRQVKFKRDLNVTIRESRPSRKAPRRRRCNPATSHAPPGAGGEDSSSCRSGASNNNDDGAADVSEDDDDDDDMGSRQPASKTRDRWTQPTPASVPIPATDSRDQWTCGGLRGAGSRARTRRYRSQHSTTFRDAPDATPRRKNRSSSLQREELLQIIQANMEKNNLSFQTSRKPCDRGFMEHRHYRHRHKIHYLQDPRTNCYLDLAGLESRNMPASGRCECRGGNSGVHGHHRSRSHDLSQQIPDATAFHHSMAPSMPVMPGSVQAHTRSRSHETELLRHAEPCRFPHIVLGHTSSPHHLKHRNREQDQARAMAQVVRWLEKEFSSTLNTADKLNTHTTSTSKQQQQQPSSPAPQPPSQDMPRREGDVGSPVSSNVERHEHHHVHEHIHHHYHHYQDAPVLV